MAAPITSLRLVAAILLLLLVVPARPEPVQGAEKGKAIAVAKDGVGESGMTAMLQHRVKGKAKKLLVLHTVGSSLCPNTGVVAMLVVNGTPLVHGTLTKPKSSIQVRAAPGDRVIAVAYAIPLHNGIQCIRQGQLKLELSERDAPK